MFNSGGAVEQFEVNGDPSTPLTGKPQVTATVSFKVRGCGRFGAYSSQCPLKCTVDGLDTEFSYDGSCGLVTVMVPVAQEEMYKWCIEITV